MLKIQNLSTCSQDLFCHTRTFLEKSVLAFKFLLLVRIFSWPQSLSGPSRNRTFFGVAGKNCKTWEFGLWIYLWLWVDKVKRSGDFFVPCSWRSYRSQLSCPHKCKWGHCCEVFFPSLPVWHRAQFDGLSNSHYRRLTAPRFLPEENTPWLEVMEAIKGREPKTLSFVCGRAPLFAPADFQRGTSLVLTPECCSPYAKCDVAI